MIAVDRQGNALYADVSVVPDVDAAQLVAVRPIKRRRRCSAQLGLPVLERLAH